MQEDSLDEVLSFDCPRCGGRSTVTVDVMEGRSQRLVQDCPVCCTALELSIGFRRRRPYISDVCAEDD